MNKNDYPDGLNDIFGAHIEHCEIKKYKMSVYNRWRQMIFQTIYFYQRRNGEINGYFEFRNNQPSITNYDVQTDGTGFQLYLKDETGRSYYSRKMWGFCNGELCYAMLDGNLCPIFSVGHSFYVFGSTDKEVKAKNNSLGRILLYNYTNGIIYVPATGDYNMHFYTIDPFSGKIY